MKTVSRLFAAAVVLLAASAAAAQDTLKVAVPQRGTWDTSISEIGEGRYLQEARLNVELLFTGGGAEVLGAIIGGSIDLSMAAASRPCSALTPTAHRFASSRPRWPVSRKSIGSCQRSLADQDAGRHERQDHRLFGRRLVEPRRAAGAAGAGEDQRQADGARRRHGKHHRRNERPGRRRLVGDAVRIEGLRRRQDPHHRPRRRRQSLAGPHGARQLYERQRRSRRRRP